MSNYSEEDKREFREKDLRINRVAILKSMLESGKVGVNDYKVNCEIAEQYVNYVYNGLQCKTEDKQNGVNWIGVAVELGLPKPEKASVELLDMILTEYQDRTGLTPNPKSLLSFIWKEWEAYPTASESVKIVLEKLTK